MNDSLNIILENYKDGIPVKIERSSVMLLSAAAVLVVAISALIVKTVKNL